MYQRNGKSLHEVRQPAARLIPVADLTDINNFVIRMRVESERRAAMRKAAQSAAYSQNLCEYGCHELLVDMK